MVFGFFPQRKMEDSQHTMSTMNLRLCMAKKRSWIRDKEEGHLEVSPEATEINAQYD